MDCFAVSVAEGAAYRQLRVRHILRMAALFGLFQGLMPVVGYLAGMALRSYIEAYDHWVAFGLLAVVGAKMIYESSTLPDKESQPNAENITMVLTLAVATSIDALAVGITLSLLHSSILLAAIVIGVITFVVSLVGVQVGKRFGHLLEKKTELIAGLLLMGLGVKILIEHLRGA